MAKSKGKTSTAKSPKAKPAPPRKATAEELSDRQRQSLLFSYMRRLKPLLMAETAAKAAVTKAYEIAKKEGVTKKEIEIALKLKTEDGAEKIKAEVERLLRIDRWIGTKIGTQLELDLPQASKAEAAFEDGRIAALNDQPAKAPEHFSQAATQQWLAGHSAGRTQLNQDRLQGMKPLGDVALGIVEKADAPPPLGTEPATHREAA